MRSTIALLGRFAFGIGIALLVLLLSLTVLVLAPPNTLLQHTITPLLRVALKHDNLYVGRVRLRPLRGIDIENLWLGPPKGFSLPMLTVRRITVRYDLGDLLNAKVRLDELSVHRPLFYLEEQNGRSNWQTLAGTDSVDRPKAVAEPDTQAAGEPSRLTATVGRVAVVNAGVYLSTAGQQVSIDGVQFEASGRFERGQGLIKTRLGLNSGEGAQSNVGIVLSKPKLALKLVTALRLKIGVSRLVPPRGEVDLFLGVKTDGELPLKLPPTRVALRLKAKSDQQQGTATLQELSLDLNGDRIARASADATDLGAGRSARVELRLKEFDLQLARLRPYLNILQPGLQLSGVAQARDLQAYIDLSRPIPPMRASGRILLQNLGVASQPKGPNTSFLPRLSLEDLNLSATIGVASDADGGPPRSDAAVEFDLGKLVMTDLRLSALRSSFDLRLTGIDPRRISLRSAAKMTWRRAAYRHAKWGWLATDGELSLLAQVDGRHNKVSLRKLGLQIGRAARLSLAGEATAGDRLEGKLRLEVPKLARAIRLLPVALRRRIGLRAVGQFEAALSVRSQWPPKGTTSAAFFRRASALWCCSGDVRSPIGLSGLVKLSRASIALAGLRIDRGNAKLTLRRHKHSPRLELALDLQRLVTPQLQLQRLNTRLRGTITPDAVRSSFDLSMGQASAAQRQLRGVKLSAHLDVSTPTRHLLRGELPPAAIRQRLSATIANLRDANTHLRALAFKQSMATRLALSPMAKHRRFALLPTQLELGLTAGALDSVSQISVEAPRLQAVLRLDPRREKSLTVRLSAHSDRILAHALGVSARAFHANLNTGLTRGVRWRWPLSLPGLDKLSSAPTNLLARIERLGHPQQATVGPLRDSHLKVAGRLHPGGRLKLEEFRLKVPTLGFRARGWAQLRQLHRWLPAVVVKPVLPDAALGMHVALDTPRTTQPERALRLPGGIRISGKTGLSLNLRTQPPGRVAMQGRLLSHAFYLWQNNRLLRKDKKGSRTDLQSLALHNLNADVPLQQRLTFDSDRGLAPEFRSMPTHTATTTLYRSLRPYRAQTANLTLDRLSLSEESTVKSGRRMRHASRSLVAGPLQLDLALRNGTLSLDRFHLAMLGGDIAGALKVQLVALKPLDARVRFRLQLTGLDLTRLAGTKSKGGQLSALLRLNYQLRRRSLAGKVNITRISLDHLDSLLAYLDPNRENLGLQQTRELINASYVRLARPSVKLVAIWIEYGNLNMDIEIDAIPGIRSLIQSTLNRNRVRRLNIIPLLPKVS